MFMVVAGGYITIMGLSPVSGTPLLAVTGFAMLVYAGIMLTAGNETSTKQRPAHPCREMNHAGCQDSPDCVCGCHRERIEVSVGS